VNQIGILSLAVALLSGEIAARKATIPAAFRGTRAKEVPIRSCRGLPGDTHTY